MEDWSSGPVRWLLLPSELRSYRRLGSHQERLDFIENFWRRRDPQPGESGNPFAETFFQRVTAADRIYMEGAIRGSLTDRGRAFVLLGSPELLRYTRRAVPTWDPARSRNRIGSDVRHVRVEIWGFGPTNLAPTLAQQVEFDDNGFVTISFVEEGDHTRLVDGEDLLRLAARFAVREGQDP